MPEDDILQSKLISVIDELDKIIVGKKETSTLSLVALLANGHVLLEGVPGVGKTMLVRALAKLIGLELRRIQFTSDLPPSDVTGVSIYSPKEQLFIFRAGPIFGDIILADEINRTSPKTQSALLEGMAEGSVTVDGTTRLLTKPFFVMATQNPVDYDGTYPLPEAQLDRFLFKLKLGYLTKAEEFEVLTLAEKNQPIQNVDNILTREDIIELQREIQQVYVDETIKHYIIDITSKTRKHPSIFLGASPRASIAIMKAAQAYAFIRGRDYIIPDDIQYLAKYTLSHRIILSAEAKYEELTAEELITDIIVQTPVPVRRTLNR